MFLRDFVRKACAVKKICGAQQKSGLKPHPPVVDSPILANFLIMLKNGLILKILTKMDYL